MLRILPLLTLLSLGGLTSQAYAGYYLYKPAQGLKPTSSATNPVTPPTTPTPAQCTTPWGTTIASGQSITSFLVSQATQDQACVSETRTCNNGTLSGTYTQQSCQPAPTINFAKFSANVAVSQSGYSVSTPLYGKYVTNIPIYSGKHYVEVNFSSYRSQIGITTQNTHDIGQASPFYPLERQPNAAAFYMTTSVSNRLAYLNSTAATLFRNYGTITSADSGVIGVAIDADNNQVSWQNQNGTIGTINVLLPKPWYFTVARGNSNSGGELNATLNSGYAPFTYTLPSGYRRGLFP